MIANSASIISAKRTAIFACPSSGATETFPRPVRPRSRKCRANSGSAVMWSTGIVKKPWICPACRSIVKTRSAPASWSMSATRRAEIGSRGFCGPRSIQCPWLGSVNVPFSRPGSASSAVVTLSMPVVDPPFLRLLARREPCKRSRGDIIRDHRAGCNPCIVTDLDGGHERIVHSGPDVAADAGGRLRLPGREVRIDVGGCDVRVLADLGVAEVREVRHLRPRADAGVLHLDERADLGVAPDLGAGANVRERPDLGP